MSEPKVPKKDIQRLDKFLSAQLGITRSYI